MNLSTLIFNDANRLRSGWRAAIFVVAFIAASIAISAIAISAMLAAGVDYEARPAFFVINGILSLIPALIIGWLCGKLLEGLPFRALGATFTDNWFRNFVVGFGYGAATVGLALGLAAAAGELDFEWNTAAATGAIARTLVLYLVVFAVAAAFEEALFRGYVLQTLTRAGWAWLGIAITALPFAIAHVWNPDAGIISSINTALAGIWLGIAYLHTRDLWLPFGVHLAWNWVLGSVFGVEVSGLNEMAGTALLKEVDGGPLWLTGETYGIEGGIACTAALLASIALVRYLPTRKRIVIEETETASTQPVS